MYCFDYQLLRNYWHFALNKVMVYGDSMLQNLIPTKIFINRKIKRKYNPFRQEVDTNMAAAKKAAAKKPEAKKPAKKAAAKKK